ncbi:glycosyltransferase family 25 protein, partial [Arthrospira platensis SPKY1]|nr:glycosyltransferase family 25 protein [Arthrospira platensis SPKY1]
MNEMLQIRVINLDRSYDRLEFVSQGLSLSGLKWSRFPAIELPESGWSDHEIYVKGQSKRFYWDDLSRGELGCFLSHLEVMKQFLSSDKT